MEEIKKPSVLIADDDSMLREMLKLILHSEGYKVVGEASNGIDAVMQCVKLKPDLVLLDINMPKMDGLQALVEIHKATPQARVIMVSALVTMDRVSEAIQNGAIGFVVKPLNPATVLDQIKMCLRKKEKA
jgi:two-component system chemotaxis response regulator CheY